MKSENPIYIQDWIQQFFYLRFKFDYTERFVDVTKSNVSCYTPNVAQAQRIFVVAPSGFRFTALVDLNPDRLRKARVSGM